MDISSFASINRLNHFIHVYWKRFRFFFQVFNRGTAIEGRFFFQSCSANSVMKCRSLPAKFDSIQRSMRSFSSASKWFFQSPVFPAPDSVRILRPSPSLRSDFFLLTFAQETRPFLPQFLHGVHGRRGVVDKVVEDQVLGEAAQLFVRQRFAEEGGDFLDTSPQVLRAKKTTTKMNQTCAETGPFSSIRTRFRSS